MDLDLETAKTALAYLGGIAVAARGFLQLVAPMTAWKGDDRLLAFLDKVLGWAALGGAPNRSKPPKRPPTGPVALLVLAFVLVGCAGRAANIHLKTAQASDRSLRLADDLLTEVCTTANAEARGQDFVDGCHEMEGVQNTAVEVHDLWTTAAASEGLDAESTVGHLVRLTQLYAELRAWLARYGRDLPEVF